MNTELEALARRAVACKGWRWMAGMAVQYVDGGRLTDGFGRYLGHGTQFGDFCIQWDDYAPRGVSADWRSPQNFRPAPHIDDIVLPDLSDPATLGCLLALVREAHEDRFGAVAYDGRWRWYGKDGEGLPVADDYAVCLVLALESAP